MVHQLGAEPVLDYPREDALQSGRKFDLILAINGNRALTEYKRALAPNGVFVLVGGALSQVIKSLLFGPFLSIGGKKMRSLAAKPNTKDMEFIIRLMEDGKIKPVIDKCYPLEETGEAMRYILQGHTRGKVIILVR